MLGDVIMKSLIIILFILFLSTENISLASNKTSSALSSIVSEYGLDKEYKVWIYFKDKGPLYRNIMEEVKNQLNKRSIVRRSRSIGNNLIDFYDLPVFDKYITSLVNILIKIHHKSRWLNALSAEITGKNIELLEELDFIDKIDIVKNYKSTSRRKSFSNEITYTKGLNGNQIYNNFNYGPSFKQMEMLNVPIVHDLGFSGKNILICVNDAGFFELSHQAMDHLNIIASWDFIENDNDVGPTNELDWGPNHGTAVLSDIGAFEEGQLISPAFDADFLLAKTENTLIESHAEEDAWIAAAEWADSLGADIISTSVGYLEFDEGEGDYSWEDMDGNTTLITKAADIAASRGILVINAVGNLGTALPGQNTLAAHADGDSVLAVGSCDSLLARASYSGMGPTVDGRIKPDVVAMSTNNYGINPTTENEYFWSDGNTSGACPQVAGVAALVMEANPDLSNMDILNLLRNTASNAFSPNNEIGYGIVNALKAVMYFRPQIEHSPQSDLEIGTDPVTISAKINSLYPLIRDSIKLFYQIESNEWEKIKMYETENNNFEAIIPIPDSSCKINYYIQAHNTKYTSFEPILSPKVTNTFYWGVDKIPPQISLLFKHFSSSINAFGPSPNKFVIKASDNIGIDTTTGKIFYSINSIPKGNVELHYLGDNYFDGTFSFDEELILGDKVSYYFSIQDNSSMQNLNTTDTLSYYIDTVQVIDDFENGTSLWDLGEGWNITNKSKNTGEFSITDSPLTNYLANSNNTLLLKHSFNLSNYKYARLEFFISHFLETGKDSILVEISNNNGLNWEALEGYTSGAIRYRKKEIDISNYTGNEHITLRFRLISDSEEELDGVYIDDISIYVSKNSNLTNNENEISNLPSYISLSQNFPNPFNPSTTIKYSIPTQSNVILKVFDVLGSEVATLVNKEQPQGNYEVEFDGAQLTSGIYFYKLQAGDPETSSGQVFVETKKMILIK